MGGILKLVCSSGLLSLLGGYVTGLCVFLVDDSDCGMVGFWSDGEHWH